jgi:bifunctional enzyme CysN/CysC/sulfate adenylyltransferase subunit 1
VICLVSDRPQEQVRGNAELLRFTTAGSVDDGKSTLIGRLLHDSKSVYEDQLASVRNSRVNRSSGPIDLSLLTDGLRAEREQGITIDVAYRYFTTSRRKFIIADTPGHEEYTRNMATGASTADLAVILIDATKGLLAQTRRHTFIASLLGISTVVGAVNKMDLAGYCEDTFLDLERDFCALANQLGIANVQCIPISALEGDNIVQASTRMPWYQGPTLIEHLETVAIPSGTAGTSLRLPIQMVIRPDATFRGFAGRIASGVIRPGDAVLALPSGQKTRVHSIVTYDGDLLHAQSPMSVTLRLEDEIDLSRGDMLVSPQHPPQVSKKIRAMVVWLHNRPLELGPGYVVKHAVRQTKIRALQILHRVNVNTLEQEPATQLAMNEIAAVEFESNVPLLFDPYSINRTTGSFILIDPLSNATVGAGMIQEDLSTIPNGTSNENEVVFPETLQGQVVPEERYQRRGHRPAVFWFKGRLTLATRIETTLFRQGFEVQQVSVGDISPDGLLDVVRFAQRAGIIVLYSGDFLDPDTAQLLASEAPGRFFDLTAPGVEADNEETIRQALAIAKSLRLTSI